MPVDNEYDEVFKLLNRPRHIRLELRRTEAELEGLRYSLYPSAIRYDTDKVVSSPSDPMPVYAVKVDELEDKIKKLQLEYIKAQDAILDATLCLSDIEQEVIMLRYVAQRRWESITYEMARSESSVFTIHRKAIKKLKMCSKMQ